MNRRFLAPVFAALIVLAVACSGSAISSNTLTVEQLKNTTYSFKDAPNGQITLQNGKGEEPIGAYSASKYTATFVEPAAFGDLTNDSGVDAADIIVTSGGGSGSFYYLAALMNQNGYAKNIASTLLGDRIKINALKIENNRITVDYLDRGPNDPMAAEPTHKMTKTYKLEGNQLVEVP